ncbi:MAG: CopG family transcriptional regulator [Betaproteobacteria bacterium]
MAVSIRVTEAKLAAARDTTVHALMVEAIHEKVEAEEARAAFHAEGRQRLAKMKKTRSGIPAADVFDYLESRARGGSPPRPKPRRTA